MIAPPTGARLGVSDSTTGEGRVQDDESDLFSVQKYASSTTSIPVLEKVPLTREEVARRRAVKAGAVILVVVAIAATAWAISWWLHRSAVRDAVGRAGADGRVATLHEALELLEDDDDDASRATRLRLQATLVLVGEDLDAESIAAAVGQLPTDDPDVARERGIAETYLALARGDLQEAMDRASAVDGARGDYRSEALRARAMAARAVGNVETATQAARHAVEQSPDAPRHVALLAELMARSGESAAALEVVDGLPADRRSPATRVARARIMDRAGAELDQVAEHAQAVLDDDEATDHEKAWARLLLARAAAHAGDRVVTRQHLDQAAEVAPPGDELFTLTLTEAALRMGADHFAQQAAEGLPTPLSIDAGRRAQLSAELALSRRDLRAAESALGHAPAGARTALARARLLEARGSFDEARALYLEAAGEPAHRIPAMVRLASMELARGQASEAAARVEPLLSEYANHPDIVPVAVEAQVGLERAAEAMRLVGPALAEHPEDVRLLAAKAHVQMALEEWEQALETLDHGLRIEDDDPDLHADRGQAARALSRMEVAREAFDAALALSESHPHALVGRLALDVEEERVAEGRRILDRVDAAEIRSLEVERLRGRLLQMEIAGRSGIAKVRAALEAHRRDESLTRSLAWLYMQAEEYGTAVRTFSRLLDRNTGPVDVILGRALAHARVRASAPAVAALERLMTDLDEETLDGTVRAELHAVQARLAWTGHTRVIAGREARRAVGFDGDNSEAHLVLADIATDSAGGDGTSEYEASLRGLHPSSRALGVLAVRAEEVTEAVCRYAERYQRAAPNGQYARPVRRVQRDCRQRSE